MIVGVVPTTVQVFALVPQSTHAVSAVEPAGEPLNSAQFVHVAAPAADQVPAPHCVGSAAVVPAPDAGEGAGHLYPAMQETQAVFFGVAVSVNPDIALVKFE